MAAYLLVDCEVTDPKQYDDYKRLAQAAVAQYGGRYVVRGGETVVLEGTWKPNKPSCSSSDLDRARRFTTHRIPQRTRGARRRGTHEHGGSCRSLGSLVVSDSGRCDGREALARQHPWRCGRSFSRDPLTGRARERPPLPAPVVVAYSRPAFDHVGPRRHGIAARRVTTALSPRRRIIVVRLGVPAVVALAVEALLHVESLPLRLGLPATCR
jgi:uncharacterized protein (DUF1330 family)